MDTFGYDVSAAQPTKTLADSQQQQDLDFYKKLMSLYYIILLKYKYPAPRPIISPLIEILPIFANASNQIVPALTVVVLAYWGFPTRFVVKNRYHHHHQLPSLCAPTDTLPNNSIVVVDDNSDT